MSPFSILLYIFTLFNLFKNENDKLTKEKCLKLNTFN